MYGIKQPRRLSKEDIQARDQRHSIEEGYGLDTNYVQRLKTTINNASLRKDMRQPLQYWIFYSGTLLANKVNCDAEGFPNLKWSIEAEFRNRKVYCSYTDNNLAEKFSNLLPVPLSDGDTTMIICYTYFMGRQNKRFLKQCNHFLEKHKSIRPIFLNMDNTYK
jgi:hypothetical protein